MDFDEQALQAVRQGRLLIDRYDAWLFRRIEPFVGRRVLEIGCGLGNMSGHLLDRERVVAIDTSGESVAEVQRKFAAHANFRAAALSITSPEALALEAERLDSAISVNVFEHIEDDQLALRHTHRLLQRGGHLILIVPAHEWLYGALDRSIGHYRRYTQGTLRAKLEGSGFRVVQQAYVNMLGALGWLVNGRVLMRRTPPTGQLKLFNRLVPLLAAFEDRIAPPFGISLLSIAQKEAA